MRAALTILVILGFLTSAQAWPSESDMDAQTIACHGIAILAATGTLLDTNPIGPTNLMLTGLRGTLSVISHRQYGATVFVDGRGQNLFDHVEEKTLDLDDASVKILQREDSFLAILDGNLLNHAPDVVIGPGSLVRRVDQEALPAVFSYNSGDKKTGGEYHRTLPPRALETSIQGALSGTGRFVLFLVGADIQVESPTQAPIRMQLYNHTEYRRGTVLDPRSGAWIGNGTHPELVHQFILLDATGTLSTTPARGSILQMDQANLECRGELQVASATGQVRVETPDQPETHDVSDHDVKLEGNHTLVVRGSQRGALQFSGTGDTTAVHYASVMATYPAGALLGTGLFAAALLLFLAKGKLAAWVGYARLHRDEVLKNGRRTAAYEAVQSHPGIYLRQLAHQLAMRPSTLAFHLRYLERAGYIESLADGPRRRYFDNRARVGSRKAIAILENARTASIAAYIREHRGTTQRDLQAAFGSAQSTVSWHLRRLIEGGLVEVRREGRRKRYHSIDETATILKPRLSVNGSQ